MRSFPFAGSVYAAFAFVLSACGGGDRAGADRFFFIQLSDPQLGMYMADSSFLQESANLEMAIATANRLRPAFVVVTGDLVNQMGNREQIAEYLRITAKLDKSIKLYNVPGNHDIGNEPTAESIEAYRKHFGPDHYSFRVGDFVGIVLNSSLIHSPGKAQSLHDAQEKWLRAELERARRSDARHVVVFQHHPWYLQRADEADEYSNIPRVRRSRFVSLLREFGVGAVISGHNHSSTIAADRTLRMVSSGSVGKPFGDAKSGLAVVTVTADGVDHRFYDFGGLPSRVEIP